MKIKHRPHLSLSLAIFTVSASALCGQTTWTTGTANWNTPSAWSPAGVPDGVAAQLGDVSSGTRIITVDSANPTITSLGMIQNTVGAINTLTLSDTLTLTGTGTDVFNQTLGTGVGADGIVVNLNTGGLLAFTGDIASATVGFNNAGTLNLAGGGVSFTTSINRSTLPTFTNTGILNSSGGSIVAVNTTGSTGTTGTFTMNNGVAEGSSAALNFNSGTTLLGRTVDGDRGLFILNNHGAILVANTAVVSLNNRLESPNQAAVITLENMAGASLKLGNATTAGTATLEFTRDGNVQTGASYNYSINNAGTVDVYGQSKILNSNLAFVGNLTLTNTSTGTLNLLGDATGVLIGGDAGILDTRTNVSLSNAGTVNVGIHSSAASGITRFGIFGTASNARGGVAIDNTGAFNITSNALLLAQAAYGGSVTYENRFTNASSGTLTLGTDGSSSNGGTLQFAVSKGRTSGTSENFSQFQNSGTTTLHGTSVIERSSTVSMAAGETSFVFSNNTGAQLNLHDTARIGNTSRVMLFSNAGTVTKFDTGISTIASSSGGTATNTGTLHVKTGTLAFSSTLDSSAASSVLRFDIGSVSAGQLTTAGELALGTGGASLNLVFTSASLATSYDLLDFTSISGSFAAVTLSGSGFSASLSRNAGIWTGSSNNYGFSFSEASGILSVTSAVPEPTTYALVLGGMALLFVAGRRRR